MSSVVPDSLRYRQKLSLRCVDHPAGADGQATTVQDVEGRAISTAPMLRAPGPVAVLRTVNVKIVPAVSPRNWTVGATEATALRPAGGFGGFAASATANERRSAREARTMARGPRAADDRRGRGSTRFPRRTPTDEEPSYVR
jgi:hypothetical protein